MKPYSQGKMLCMVCDKWLDPIIDAIQIRIAHYGKYHKREYCNVWSPYGSRLREKGHTVTSRRKRQASAIYYWLTNAILKDMFYVLGAWNG